MHSLASGSTSDAAQLVQANWLEYVGAGRTATVVGWLDSLGPSAIASDPAARVTAAWMAAMSGDQAALTDHLTALEEFKELGPLPDGSRSVESAIAMIHGRLRVRRPGRDDDRRPAGARAGDGRSIAVLLDRAHRSWSCRLCGRRPGPGGQPAGEGVAQRGGPSDHPDAGAGRAFRCPRENAATRSSAASWPRRRCRSSMQSGCAGRRRQRWPSRRWAWPRRPAGRWHDGGDHHRTGTGAAPEEPGAGPLGIAPPPAGGGAGGPAGRRTRDGDAAGRGGVDPDGSLPGRDGAHAGAAAAGRGGDRRDGRQCRDGTARRAAHRTRDSRSCDSCRAP